MKIRQQIKKLLYGKFPGLSGAFPYYGTKVYFPQNSLIFQIACDQGIYERYNLKLISSLIRPKSVYFDIGANIGLMSIPILHDHPDSTVVSMEASPKTLEFLVRTAKGSKFTDRWHIIGKAAGSSIGNVDFYVAATDKGAFDGFIDTKRGGEKAKVSVPMTTIDMEWEAMGKPPVSMIKIDVEGAEIETLNGALTCIQEKQPYILVEWNVINLTAYNCKPEVLLNFAIKVNYQLISLPGLLPINDLTFLELHMIQSENFLLVPHQKQNEKNMEY
jgi:FkbM family methyltransferase